MGAAEKEGRKKERKGELTWISQGSGRQQSSVQVELARGKFYSLRSRGMSAQGRPFSAVPICVELMEEGRVQGRMVDSVFSEIVGRLKRPRNPEPPTLKAMEG